MAMFQPRSRFEMVVVSRHPEGVGNAARQSARDRGDRTFTLAGPDRLLGLTKLGRRQGFSLGLEIGGFPRKQQPSLAVCSNCVRTVQGVDEFVLGSGLKLVRDSHYAFRDANRGDRAGYVSSKAYFKDHPIELARQKALGKLFYRFPGGGEADIDFIEGRVGSGLREIERKYARHKVVFFMLSHTAVRAVLAYYLGLDEEQYDTLCDQEIENAAYCVLVRDKSGCLKMQRDFHVASLLGKKKYARLHAERQRQLAGIAAGK